MDASFIKALKTLILLFSTAFILEKLTDRATAQIIVNYGNSLAEYSAYGIPVTTNLVKGLNQPQGIAVSGTNIFVVNYGSGSIGKYTLSGAVVNANLILGLSHPEGIAISGSNIFVANYSTGTIGEFTLSGAVVNRALISGLHSPVGIAISGSNIFVSTSQCVGEYTVSGDTVNTNLIPISAADSGLAVSGTNLYIAYHGGVAKYSTSGTFIALFPFPGLYPNANGIAVSGDLLYVLRFNGEIGAYTTSGATNNPSLFSTIFTDYDPFGIAVIPESAASAPTTLAANTSRTNIKLSWPTNGSRYLLQTSPLLSASNWTIVTNTPVVTNGNYSMSLSNSNPNQFFRLQSINPNY